MTAPESAAEAERPAGIITRRLAAILDLLVVLLIMSALYGGLVLVRLVYSPAAFSPAIAERRVLDARHVRRRGGVPRGMLDGVGIHRGCGDDGSACRGPAVAAGEPACRLVTCGRLRAFPDRPAVGRDRLAAKIIAGHRVAHAGGLLTAVRRCGLVRCRRTARDQARGRLDCVD